MSSSPLRFRFIELPLELQREIFLASGLEDINNATRLVCVSKRAYNWIAPIIYNMVTLGSEDTALFLRTLASKPAEFFATHVKCLCLSVSVTPVDAEKILSICSGVRRLAFWVNYLSAFPGKSITHLISPLSLRRLSIEARHLRSLRQSSLKARAGEDSRWYTNLTHLDIVFWPEDTSLTLPDLTHFRSLTHVGLWQSHRPVEEKLISEVLDSCKRVQILLVVVHESDMTQRPCAQDRRVVFMPYPTAVVVDWEASFTGKPNTWSRAQEAYLAAAKPPNVSDPNGHNSGDISS